MRQPEAVKLAKELMVPAAYLMCVDEESTISAPKRWLLDRYDAADARGKRMIELVAEAQATQQQPTFTALPQSRAL